MQQSPQVQPATSSADTSRLPLEQAKQEGGCQSCCMAWQTASQTKDKDTMPHLLHDGLKHEVVALIVHALRQWHVDRVVGTPPHTDVLRGASACRAQVM